MPGDPGTHIMSIQDYVASPSTLRSEQSGTGFLFFEEESSPEAVSEAVRLYNNILQYFSDVQYPINVRNRSTVNVKSLLYYTLAETPEKRGKDFVLRNVLIHSFKDIHPQLIPTGDKLPTLDYILQVLKPSIDTSGSLKPPALPQSLHDNILTFVGDLLNCFFVQLVASGGAESVPPSVLFSPPSVLPHPSSICARSKAVRDECREREGWRCCVSNLYDASRAKDLRAVNKEVPPGRKALCEVAHIFPISMGISEDADFDEKRKFFWKVLGMFAPTAAAILHGSELDSVKNTLFLAHDMHHFMGTLNLWFEATEEQHTYLIKTSNLIDEEDYEILDKVTFTNKDIQNPHDLPSPILLKTHAALCRVLHLSGAAGYVRSTIQGMERLDDVGVLTGDGSSSFDLMVYFTQKGLVY